MSMPFPGMDPYLEHAALWPGLHNRLIVALASQLRPLIRPRYIASIEERIYLERPQHQRLPDLAVQKVRETGPGPAVAVAALDSPVVVESVRVEVRETYIELLDRYNNMRLVTFIEVVSPSNKEAGPGRNAYLAKQRGVLAKDCHLVEIDLLRRGGHVLSIPEEDVKPQRPYDYIVCVNRWPHRDRYELYPRRLSERLPRVRLPLAEPDPDVPLDIQAALEYVYDDGDYVLRLKYDEPCEPALPPAEQQWATERLAAYKEANPDLFPPANP